MKRNIISALFILGLVSCDSFLDVKPKAEIVENVFFNTADGFEDALYGTYSSLSRSQLYGENLSWGTVDVFAQYYKMGIVNDNTIAMMSLNHLRIKPLYAGIWASGYESIGYINNVLRNLEKPDNKNMRYRDLYKGEALGLRALLHFDLLRLFAPHIERKPQALAIPYVTIYEAKVSPFKKVEEVYNLIITDLKEAEQLLVSDAELLTYPRKLVINDGFGTAREIHFNLYAAQALLARIYWMKGDLENAYLYAKKVIDSKRFPLADKLEIRNLVAGTISSNETIFGIYSKQFFDPVNRAFYTYDPTFTWIPASDNLALYSVSQEEGNDMRGNNWFRILIGDNVNDNVVRCMKIVNEEKINNPAGYKAVNQDGVNLIRIPEMYLIAAEAQLTKDPLLARSYFDKFIESRGLYRFADRAGNPMISLADINKERRKEYVQEGQYFYVMKKYNMDIHVLPSGQTIKGSDEIYTLQIPDDEYEFRYTEED